MNIQKLFEDIRSRDAFNAFWTYPKEKNLSMVSDRLSYVKSPKELRSAIAQICALVFESNEEGSFLHTEAQNLLKYSEDLIERAITHASVTGAYIDMSGTKEDKDTNKFILWENAVTHKLCERYMHSILEFAREIHVPEVQQHIAAILWSI
ncbi:hypothetical protein NECID01_0333 [Nematocida sp. AWRm77]|nr:hypothetical protein NECID01_0333 [Nematocida sp. AWRm77]